jgi:hypothetical protein
MAFNEFRATVAALALLAASVAPVAAQTPIPSDAAANQPAPEAQRMQTAYRAPEPSAALEDEATATEAGDDPVDAQMEAEELAAGEKRCNERKKAGLRECNGRDFQCKTAVMKRRDACLALLKAR